MPPGQRPEDASHFHDEGRSSTSLSGIAPEEEDAAFQKLLYARNSSFLAHGVDPIGERTAEKFLKYIDTLVTVPEDLRSGAKHAELLVL